MGMMYSSYLALMHILYLQIRMVTHPWILDSSAFHVTPRREWFSDYRRGRHGVIHLGDNYAFSVVRIDTRQSRFWYGSVLTLQHVQHVLQLKA